MSLTDEFDLPCNQLIGELYFLLIRAIQENDNGINKLTKQDATW